MHLYYTLKLSTDISKALQTYSCLETSKVDKADAMVTPLKNEENLSSAVSTSVKTTQRSWQSQD